MSNTKTRKIFLSLENNKEYNSKHYSVYIVLLSDDVLSDNKFKRLNPNHKEGMSAFYVGMTGIDPTLRFLKHKAGIKHNKYVLLYGIKLLDELTTKLTNMTYEEALAKEKEVGENLRSLGHPVYFA